jgi:hypothetical protein
MKKTFTTLLILFLGCTALLSQAPVPEILYYNFNGSGTTVPNLASNPPAGTATATIMGGITQGSTGQCSGALVGSGNSSSSDYLNTGYAPALTGTSWTISMWTSNITPSSTLFYIFGDANSGSFRCFTNGVAGANNWILRGTFSDVLVSGGATVAPHVTTFVYDQSAATIAAYLDGVLVNTVSEAGVTINGTGPFKVMGYASNVGSPSGGLVDEFRMYNRALTAAEIMQLVNPMPVVSLGNDSTACGSITLDAQNAGASYLWSDGSTAQTFTATSTATYSVTVTEYTGCSASDAVNETIHPLPVIDFGQDSTVCGSVTLDAQNAGSTYLWSDASTAQTLTTSISGIYSVMITDAFGCMNGDTIMETINPIPSVNIGSDITQCADASPILLDAQNAGSTYLWSDASTNQTITVSSTGIYSVVVTDVNGCMNADTMMATVNPVPVVDLGNNIIQCADAAAITLDAQNAGASFLWNDGSTTETITVSTSGTYSVTVTDANGCMNYSAMDLTVNPLPVVNLGNDVTQCGGTVTLDAGNQGSDYLWSDSSNSQTITVFTTGNYIAFVTDANGCMNGDTVNVTINTIPTVTGSASANTVCLNDADVVLTGTPAGGTWTGTGVSGSSFTPMTAGTGAHFATYTYTDVNGCSNTAAVTITVNACVGVEELNPFNGISIYPNPNNGMFTLNSAVTIGDMNIVITDLQGRVVYSSMENNVNTGFNQQINLQAESAGIYFMTISANGQQRTDKISVQK